MATDPSTPSRESPPWPMTGPAPCASHPDRETLVHCNSCGRPVCPDCMVYSPVGVKCRQCAKLPRSALAMLRGRRLALTIAAAIGAGTVIGFAYYFLLAFVGFFFLAFFVAAAMGYVVAEAVLRASRHYRGKETAWIAVGGTLWAFLFPLAVSAVGRLGVGWNAVVLTFAGRGIINWVVMLVACWIAYQRNR